MTECPGCGSKLVGRNDAEFVWHTLANPFEKYTVDELSLIENEDFEFTVYQCSKCGAIWNDEALARLKK